MLKRLNSCLVCIFYFTINLWGQCNSSVDTLYFEQFEGSFPSGWEFKRGVDGAEWQLADGGFGRFKNPGLNKWVFLEDRKRKNQGSAKIITSEFDLTSHKDLAELSFNLNFQEFDKRGKCKVEIKKNGQWVLIYETNEDTDAKVIIDISDLVATDNRVRFTYNDGGVEGWGMGIDNFLLTGSSAKCGDGVCEPGENPDSCPGDCPKLTEFPQTWIPLKQDIYGKPVKYQKFQGNRICDDCSQEINLGFDFQFYDSVYTRVFINSNGNVSFGEDFVNYVPQAFCLKGPAMIAPFFSDVDLSKGGEVSYYVDPENHYLIVNWDNISYFGCEQPCQQRNSFQLLMTDGSIQELNGTLFPASANVLINYGDMNWTGGKASGGHGGFGGEAATVGVNSGDGKSCQAYGTFDNPGFSLSKQAAKGDLCGNSGVNHLDYQHIFFNTHLGEISTYRGIYKLKGAPVSEGIKLNWWVDCLKEGGFFVIERLHETGIFEEVSTLRITEEQFKSQVDVYEYIDRSMQSGENNYRVHYLGVEGDEQTDSLQVEYVKFGSDAVQRADFEILSYGPNPLQAYLEVFLGAEKPKSIQYELLDMSGRLFKAGSIELTGYARNSLKIRTVDLSAGMYVLSLRSNTAKQHIRLTKK